MIKELFNKETFVSNNVDKTSKKHSLILTIITAVLYVFAAFCMFNFIYAMCDVVGSFVSGSPDAAIRDILRSLPIFLSFVATYNLLALAHNFRRNVSKEIRNKSLKYNSIAAISLAGVIIVTAFINLFRGAYDNLIEGYPSPLYPLDSILYSLFIIAVGILSLVYSKKWEEKHPYLGVNRSPSAEGKEKVVHHIFLVIWTLISLYGLAAFILSPIFIDWIHGHVFFSLMLVLMLILPTIYLLWWEFYYNELKATNRKNNLIPALVGLCVGVIVVGLYCLAYNLDPQAPNLADFTLLAIDYTASVNATALLYSACNLIVPFVAVIKAIIANKKSK